MIINRSKRLILPLFDEYINLTYTPLNTYLFNNKHDNTFTLLYEFDDKLISTGYETFGFIKFDKYILNHNLFIDKVDFKEYVAYIITIPIELNDTIHKIKNGDFELIYNDHKPKMRVKYNNELGLNKYKTYESFRF